MSELQISRDPKTGKLQRSRSPEATPEPPPKPAPKPVVPWKVISRREIPEDAYSIALTGHRPAALDGYNLSTAFYRELEEGLVSIAHRALKRYGKIVLHSGMALGADTVWSKAILRLREEFPDDVYFVAEVPVRTQPNKWIGERDKKLWREHVKIADQVRIYGESYAVHWLHARNHGMINAADLLIAVWNGSETGGTAEAVGYAQKHGTRIWRIDPEKLKASTNVAGSR